MTRRITLLLCAAMLIAPAAFGSVRILDTSNQDLGHAQYLKGNLTKPDEVTALIDAPPTGSCPDGEFLTGFDTDTLDCEAPAGGGSVIVQKADVNVDTAATTLDFSSGFTATSSPSGEANIAIAGGSAQFVATWNAAGVLQSNSNFSFSGTSGGTDGVVGIAARAASNGFGISSIMDGGTTTPAGGVQAYLLPTGMTMGLSQTIVNSGLAVKPTYTTTGTSLTQGALIAETLWTPSSNPSSSGVGTIGGVLGAYTNACTGCTRGNLWGAYIGAGVGLAADSTASFSRVTGLVVGANGNRFVTIDEVTGILVRYGTGGTGATTDLYGVRISNPAATNVTNLYGLKVDTLDYTATNVAPIIADFPAAQTIAAGNTVKANACGTLKLISSAGAVTTDTTNTFTAPIAANKGCIMHVCNSGSNNITLDTNANFKSAGAADVVLTADDCVTVGSTGGSGVWYQLTALEAN